MPLGPRRPHRPHVPHPHIPGHSAPVHGIVHEAEEGVQELRERERGRRHRRHGISPLARWLARAAHSRVAAAPWFREFHAYVEEQIARDDGEEFLRELKAMALEETRRRHDVVHVARAIAARFHPPLARQRFASEVLGPASRGAIDGPTAWDRTDAIAGMPVLRTAGGHKPGWTIGIGGGLEGGFFGGLGGSLGLCGARFGETSLYMEGGPMGGAIVEADAGLQVEFAPGPPEQFGGFCITVELGGSVGLGGSFALGAVPTVGRKPLRIEKWTFNSFAVQLEGGVGVDASIGASWGIVMPFGSHQVYYGGRPLLS